MVTKYDPRIEGVAVHRGVWRRRYENGDLVLAQADGKLQVMVVIGHTGDCHHRFMAVRAMSMAGGGPNGPGPYCQIEAKPDEIYTGYGVGPKLAHLDDAQMVNLGGGVKIPPLRVDLPLNELLLLSERQPCRVEQRATA